MTAHCKSKKIYLPLGEEVDEEQEEGKIESKERTTEFDRNKDDSSIEPLSVARLSGMTNNEINADLASHVTDLASHVTNLASHVTDQASNVTVVSGAKYGAVVNKSPQLNVESGDICNDDDDGDGADDYRREKDTTDNTNIRVSCSKAHIEELDSFTQGMHTNNPKFNPSGLNTATSCLGQPLLATISPYSNCSKPRCDDRKLSEDAELSTSELCSSSHLHTEQLDAEEAKLTLKKSQDINKVRGENEKCQHNFMTSYRSDVESCVDVSPPQISRENSLRSSNISKPTHNSVAPDSAQSAHGDSSPIFTPDVVSGKGICPQAGIAARSDFGSQIPDYLSSFKQDFLVSPGSTSQTDKNTLITFSPQHNNNNCSLISAHRDLSPSCGCYNDCSDVESSKRNESQVNDRDKGSQSNTDLLEKGVSNHLTGRYLHESRHCQQAKFQKDKERPSNKKQVETQDNQTCQDYNWHTDGRVHIFKHGQGPCVQDDQLLVSRLQAATNRTQLNSVSSDPVLSVSSTPRFSLQTSCSSPAVVNAEYTSLPSLNTDTDDGLGIRVKSSIDAHKKRFQPKLTSTGCDLELRPPQPGLSAECTANNAYSCSPSVGSELIDPLRHYPDVTGTTTRVNDGLPEISTHGRYCMLCQGTNGNFCSQLANLNSDNNSPDIRNSGKYRLFDQRQQGSTPDLSLRKCFSCSNLDFNNGWQSALNKQANNQIQHRHLEILQDKEATDLNGQPCFPDTEDIPDSLFSGVIDKVVPSQKIKIYDQKEDNDNQRFIQFHRDDRCRSSSEDGNRKESPKFTRMGLFHQKDPAYIRTYNTEATILPISLSSSTPCMAQVHAEASPCLTPPAIRITSTPFGDSSPGSAAESLHQTALPASGSPSPVTDIYTTSSQKRRVSFINGLRRLSREKTAFLRVEQSCSSTPRVSSSATQCAEKHDGAESVRVGKRFGRENKRRLKVEFAVMDTDIEKAGSNKAPGNSTSGFFSIKDDVENDVAMLGGGGGRFRHPRVSLLGKPLNYKAHRRDVSYRRLQARVYNFLERPKSCLSWIYHLSMFLLVLIGLTMGVLSSITEFEKLLLQYAVYLEVVILLWILLELGLRVWSAGCRSRYQGKSGRLRFLRRPLCIIDMVLVLASVSSLIVGSTQEHFSQAVLSGLRFFQILRMVRMDRKGGSWKLLGSVVWAHRQELVTTLYIGLLGLVFSSYFVYLAEKDEPRLDNGLKGQLNNTEYKPKFSNFADAIWWGVVTLCTVGYGDVVPATWGGKVIASFSAILGISFFALPAGILGSGFALKVQQQQRQKHLNRRRIPAANLIQCLWRCYAADELSMSTATWKPHLIPCPSPPSERTFKNNTSFVSRFSTRRRDRGNNATGSFSRDGIQTQSPMNTRHHCRRPAISTSEEEVTNVIDRSHLSLATGPEHRYQLDTLPFRKENSVTSIGKESEEEDLSPRLTQLTEQHKRIIRVIRKIRYFVSRRKFREALRPYDVKDVIEQYSAGHIDMLGRIKNLQGRLDQILGRQGSKSKDVYESKVCLASRIVKVERQVEDIETKLDMLLDMYKEDRKLLLQHLNISQKGAIQVGPSHPPPPPPSAPSSQFKPRPILIDKQFTSEPATPTGIGLASSPRGRLQGIKPGIQRNLSDLSQRIKKRVTYRGLYLQDPPSRAQSAANFASIQPSHFSMATSGTTATSPDEISSTTVSETTRDESSENIISLNDIDSPLILDIRAITGDTRHEAVSFTQVRASDSASSLVNMEEMYFFGSSDNSPGLRKVQQAPISSPLNSPLMRVKILSTLNEQLSLESDTSQSCNSSSPPTPPINQNAADISRNTPPGSVSQSPLIHRQRHLSGSDKPSQSYISSPLSSRRPRKPILRLPSTSAPTAPPESFTITNNASPQHLTTPTPFSPNYVNSTHDILFQTEDTSKLCNTDDDSTEIDGVTNRSCRTSEL